MATAPHCPNKERKVGFKKTEAAYALKRTRTGHPSFSQKPEILRSRSQWEEEALPSVLCFVFS